MIFFKETCIRYLEMIFEFVSGSLKRILIKGIL